MAGFKIDDFKGLRPKLSATKLGKGEAQTALNLKLGSTDLEPIPEKQTTQALNMQAKSIFLYNNAGDPIWFEWTEYVDVALGPVKDDSLERIYYTGDTTGNGAPKLTTNQLAKLPFGSAPYPNDWLYIGVPAPVSAPTVTPTTLPEDKPAAQRFAEDFRADNFLIDLVDFTVYPGAGTRNQTWRLNSAATGSIAFEVDLGTAFRVTEVVNVNKVKIESATEPGITMRTLNSDKSTVNDWHPMDEQGTAAPNQEADFIGWRVPPGMEIKIAGHNLNVGDVIVVSAINGPPEFWASSTTDFNEANWPYPPLLVPDNAATGYQNRDVSITGENFTGYGQWSIYGSFYYDVDRASSTVSELEDRSYVYTYVNSFGEEGPPSPPSEPTPLLDTQSVLLSDLALPPTIGYDITLMRLYRTNSTEAGTEYQFVKEFNVSRTTRDEVPSDSLGEIISTTTWDPPDPGMKGIVALPNGILAGFNGKQIYFCEPYFPHAWPPEYDQAVEHEIVGLAVLGNSLVIMTKGWPYVASGSHSRNMNLRPIKVNQACVSKESIATDGERVLYASPDGLVEISSNGLRVITEDTLDPKDWLAYSPSTMVGEFYEGRYYGWYDFDASAVPAVVTAELSGTITSADEADIVNGGNTIVITLTNDAWVAAGTAFDNQRQNIIDNITCSTNQTLGWNNQIRDIELTPTDVVRTSDTVVTITMPSASGYAIDSNEVVTCTVPFTALVDSTSNVVCGSTFTIVPQAFSATITIGGSLATEAQVVAGSETITLSTAATDTWVTTLTDTMKQDIINGIVSTTDELNGWNDTVQQLIPLTNVVRTSDTLVTVTLPAVPLYSVTENESLIATVPHEALVTQQDVDITSSNSHAIAATGQASAVFSGTVTESVTENQIIAGGKTIIITLTNDTWIAAGTGPIGTTVQSDALVDAILATSSPSNGWNNVVVPGIEGSGAGVDLVRTSDTVATITLDAAPTYSISANETVGMTIPNDVLVTSTEDLVVGNTFGIQFQSPVTCVLSGTVDVSPALQEDAFVAGGETIILTLSNDTWVTAGATFDGQRQNIIDGLVASSSPTNGWNNEFIGTGGSGSIDVTNVVRTSDTIVTITLPADAQYNITSAETITATIPASAMTISALAVVASPTFTIDPDIAATAAITGTADNDTQAQIRTGGSTIIITLTEDTWVATGATFDAQRQNIINGCTAASSPAGGWNDEVRDGTLSVTDVVRTSDTVVTITLPATPDYNIIADEAVTVTVPASALVQSTIAVVATNTVDIDANIDTVNMIAIAPITNTTNYYAAVATDSFTSWTEYEVATGTSTGNRFDGVVYCANDTKTWILAGESEINSNYTEIWRSTNDGATWTSVHYDTTPIVDPRGIFYHDTHNLWIVTAFSNNLWYSTDDGANWTLGPTESKLSGDRTIMMDYGGSNYILTKPSPIYVSPSNYDYKYARSADLSGGGTPITSAWTEYQLTFDGAVVAYADGAGVGSGNGKNLFCIRVGSTLYLSSVPHNSTTETYIGSISLTNASGLYWYITYGDLGWAIMSDGGVVLTCPSGSEGTIGNWTDRGFVLNEYAENINISHAFQSNGNVGDGLGLVYVAYTLDTVKGKVYTSFDGSSFTLRDTFTNGQAARWGACKYPVN